MARILRERRRQPRRAVQDWPVSKYYVEGAAIAAVLTLVWLNAAFTF